MLTWHCKSTPNEKYSFNSWSFEINMIKLSTFPLAYSYTFMSTFWLLGPRLHALLQHVVGPHNLISTWTCIVRACPNGNAKLILDQLNYWRFKSQQIKSHFWFARKNDTCTYAATFLPYSKHTAHKYKHRVYIHLKYQELQQLPAL